MIAKSVAVPFLLLDQGEMLNYHTGLHKSLVPTGTVVSEVKIKMCKFY